MRHATDERNRAIAAAYRSGKTLREIAAQYSLSPSRVSYIVKAQGASLTGEELRRRFSEAAKRTSNDPAVRAKISATISARWAAGHWAGRRKILGDDPERREDYLLLRDTYGAAYARRVMGIAA